MIRPLQRIEIAVTLESPYLVHGNDPGRYGLDATLLLDHRGRPVLPGTLLAGRIVETWHNMPGNAEADRWFGIGGVNGAGQAGQRARIATDDLVLTQIDGQPAVLQPHDIARIRQDDDTGAVESGALLIVEQIAAPGARLTFEGAWHCWADEDEMASLIPQLRMALLLQTQLGAYRNVGFGRLRGCTVAARPSPGTPLRLDPNAERQRFALRGDAPLCVGSLSRRGNVFESSDVVSGAAILGAIARMLAARHGEAEMDNKDNPLAKHFSLLRCTHALPANLGGARPIPLPQSLVMLAKPGKKEEKECKDAFRHKTPPVGLVAAPAFQTDWKAADYKEAAANQGWGETRRHLRVRTDIDGQGKAKEGALFAYECVAAPLDADGNPQTEWLFDLDLADVPQTERSAVRQALAELLGHGLFPLGKTDARVAVHPVAAGNVWNTATAPLLAGQMVPVALVSDALLFTTDAIADRADIDLAGLYRAAFDDLISQCGTSGALTLSHHFATQHLAGGGYMQRRFRKDKPYQPWVLTEAGSVFVFEVRDPAQAGKVFQSWQAHGLPLPDSVKKACGATWQDHPYLPQNGYGEVAVNPQHPIPEL